MNNKQPTKWKPMRDVNTEQHIIAPKGSIIYFPGTEFRIENDVIFLTEEQGKNNIFHNCSFHRKA